MASLNKVMLIGNVGSDPEVRYLGGDSNSKVATIRLATTERYRARSGESTEKTEWHSVVAWRGLADVVEKYVKKGSQLYVEGRLSTRQWNDKSGNTRYSTEITADNLFLLGKRTTGEESASTYNSPYQGYPTPRQTTPQPQAYQQSQSYQPAPSYLQQTPKPQDAPPQESVAGGENDDLPF